MKYWLLLILSIFSLVSAEDDKFEWDINSQGNVVIKGIPGKDIECVVMEINRHYVPAFRYIIRLGIYDWVMDIKADEIPCKYTVKNGHIEIGIDREKLSANFRLETDWEKVCRSGRVYINIYYKKFVAFEEYCILNGWKIYRKDIHKDSLELVGVGKYELGSGRVIAEHWQEK